MAYPIAVLVTQDSTPSQREFAAAAACVVADVERVGALVADEGLKLMGVTELDLEVAVHKLGQHFDGVRCGNPEVIYEEGPPRLEPYYRATVESPEDCWSELMADMADRRGLITAITDVASGKQFVAEVPVSECFGYSTKVWWLSKGRGKYSLEFSHYGKLGGSVSPNPAFNRTRRQAASFLGERQWRRVPVNLGVTRESMSRDIRAFAVGVALFVALYAIYWLALAVGVNDERLGLAVAGLGYAVPLVAGGATAYLAGSHQFAALLALGVVGAASIGVINFVASALGASSDFPGAASIPLVAALSLFVQVPLVLVGGAIVGLWLRSRHA